MIIKINPLFGIQLNDTTLTLGMTKEDVITSLAALRFDRQSDNV